MTLSKGDPFHRFAEWMKEAEKNEPEDPNAMSVTSAALDGRPSTRMVLLKAYDERGFVFYTNYESRKGRQILANPNVALLFHWKSLRRQINIEGHAKPVSNEEADAYFATRPVASRIGAWASQQSRPLTGRFELEKRIAEFTLKFGLGETPRPPHWSGFCVAPERMEFWSDKPFRLHERLVYLKDGDGWRTESLYP
ncbi:pyridoxine/pyridoxamine 5'-phosphate oxidase [Alphaproteobacteria bacterium]|nr:pyridoxine/pyridoxamine 5'-phosphate oxidase [Alphaproteobacteria bacterium]